MATTQFAFVNVGVGLNSGNIPVLLANTIVAEGKTPSASNQQTTAVAPTTMITPMCRVSTDTAVYVAFGTNPDATTAGTRILIPANGVEYVRVVPGDKAAVVLA